MRSRRQEFSNPHLTRRRRGILPSPSRKILTVCVQKVTTLGVESLVLGIVGSVGAVAALVWCLSLQLRPERTRKELLGAFEALEADFEEQKESVASTLGRISRLKRDMVPVPTVPSAGEANATKNGGAPPAAPLTRSQLLAKAHKLGMRGVYGEVESQSGTDGG